MADAACASTDPKLFYPEKGDAATERAARAVCSGCPVRDECLTYALDHREVFGIWGGKSTNERRRLQRQRRRAAA
jgi:WhiB family redox-sensing transcriptional regulator